MALTPDVDQLRKTLSADLSLHGSAFIGTEKTFVQQLDNTFGSLRRSLAGLRTASEEIIFLDFASPKARQTESCLWEAHVDVNQLYRTGFSHFHEGKGKKLHVGRRRLETHYQKFIKSSLSFYGGFLQRVALPFGGVTQVIDASRKFDHDHVPLTADQELQIQQLQSCYLGLIRLGDLSRWRETEVPQRQRDWSAVQNYYSLARTLDPTSGHSFNQLAVIAQTNRDHLHSIYYLYRAAMVERPFPRARENLEHAWRKALSRPRPDMQDVSDTTCQALFVNLHAHLYYGTTLHEHEEAVSHILSYIADALQRQQQKSLLQEFSLINIASEDFARERNGSNAPDPQAEKAANSLLLLNLRMFTLFLATLVSQIGQPRKPPNPDVLPTEILTPTLCYLLPTLRQYSSWLAIRARSLFPNISISPPTYIERFWKLYTEALNLLSQITSKKEAVNVDYFLAEDEDVIDFMPLLHHATQYRFCGSDVKFKKTASHPSVNKRSEREEMLFRIQGLAEDGRYIMETYRQDTNMPIMLIGGQFVHQECEMPSASYPGDNAGLLSTMDDEVESVATSASVSAAMLDMVVDLVESEASRNYEEASMPTFEFPRPLSDTALEASSPSNHPTHRKRDTLTANEFARLAQLSTDSAALAPPSLQPGQTPFPTILNNTFTPLSARRASTQSSQPLPPALPSRTGATATQDAFQADLDQRQREILLRSSLQPPPDFTSSPSSEHIPSGRTFRLNNCPSSLSFSSRDDHGSGTVAKKAHLGAISTQATPTSAQPEDR